MLVFLILGVCLLQVGQTQDFTPAPNSNTDVYYPSITWSNSFDWKLLKEYAPLYRNLLISPISLKIILSLLYQGSSGITKREFENVLEFHDQQSAREESRDVIKKLQDPQSTEYLLNLGTRVFLDSPIEPQQRFASIAKEFYEADITPTNFSDPEDAGKTINSWAEKLTNGRISQLVSPGDLSDAIMVLTNALYFKGTWKYPFSNHTDVSNFYVLDGDNFLTIQTRFMSTEDKFFYHESMALDAKILRLPYKGGRYSMFIMLPNSKGGLPSLITHINLNNIKTMLYLMDQRPVHVILPKFRFDFQARYSKTLQDFGLLQMFQNTASFPGIARGDSTILRKLVVSDIIQKSGIEVNEQGTVAFAASEVTIGNKFGKSSTFHANHPFLFYIEEELSGNIVFIGKVENPLEIDPEPLEPKPED